MIKNIIFDFGDVFINLDKNTFEKAPLELFKIKQLPNNLIEVHQLYEMGKITTEEFIQFNLNLFPHIKENEIILVWNSILKNFPKHRLTFIKEISKTYNCYLLSNTNQLHIDWIKKDWGMELFIEFKNCFKQFYLSHEIGMRKPNTNIYNFVLESNNLIASQTLFIDDTKENTDSAKSLGLHTWNINPIQEDVVNLFTIKKELF